MDHESTEQSRETQIVDILQSNNRHFEEYLASPDFKPQELPTPSQINSIFIPRRVLELSGNPEKVKVQTVTDELKNSLWLRIVENNREIPRQSRYSNPYNFLSGTAKINFESPGPHPYVFLSFLIQSAKDQGLPQVVEVGQYEDNPILRRRGMSKNFYENLENVLRKLKFKFIFGHHNKENVDFFIKILGRKRLCDYPDYWKFNPWRMDEANSPLLTFKEL